MALKKNRTTFTFMAIIVFLTCIIMALGATAVALFMRIPLAEPMALTYSTPTAVMAAQVVEQATTSTVELSTETPSPTSTAVEEMPPAVQASSSCGGHGSLLLLFVGADFSGGVWPKGADAVRVVKVDFDQEKITVVAFPRDLWVNTPQLANQSINATRLGLSYYYMKNATMGAEKHRVTVATTEVGQALYDNFGIAPETYLTVQLDNFSALIDAVGGVDINIPEAFVSERNMYFAQGMQHLNGEQSKEYVRTYLPGGDPARRQRQNLFVKALQQNLLNAGIVTKLPDLANQFNQSFVTDLTPELIAELTCMVQAVPQEQVSFYEVNGDLVISRNIGENTPVLDPNVEQVKAKLHEWLGE